MKRMIFKSLIIFVLLAMMAIPAFAYGSIQGQVIDSLNLDGWTHYGEVWVYDTVTGDVCGTGTLDSTGGFSITLNGTQDDLSYGTIVDCTTPAHSGNTFEILIDFTCSMGVAGCDASVSDPQTQTIQFTQNGLPISFNAGFVETGTGPNALDLVDFSVTSQSSSNTWLPFVLLIGSVALVSGAVTVIRKRRA